MPTTLPPRRPPEPSDLDDGSAASDKQPRAWQGIQGIMLGMSLVGLLALLVMPLLFPEGGRGPLLRVAIAEPTLEAPDKGEALSDSQARLIRHAAVDAILRALASRQGVRASYVADPSALEGSDEPAADEVVRLRLRCSTERCAGRLRRERLDGSATWQPMPVRFAVGDLRNVDRRLSTDIKLSHMSYKARDGGARLLADEDGYRRYLEAAIAVRAEGVGASRAQYLNALETLRQRAPRFMGAYLIAADLLIASGPRNYPDAVELLEKAHRIAPGDWRPLDKLMPLITDDAERSNRYFRRLERMLPGDSEIDPWRPPATPTHLEESP